MDAKKRYEDWLENPYFDENTKNELRRIADDEKEIEERFYKELEFGTGGLRGIIGAGTNRMNIYTVRKATQGLANFILKENVEKKGVAVAFDSRNMSLEFAQEAALCLAANGIKAYVFSSLRPTPILSFALRTLGCTAGIVITASHNPPEYNGYKVYWEDGAQITYPKDVQIIEEVNAVTDYAGAKTMSRKEAEAAGLYQVIGDEIDDQYMKALKSLVIHPEIIREEAQNLKIVYTPLHGTGNIPVRRILKELGFENVYVVKEQELPDGDFPTVSYPNPEDKNAFCLALKLAKEKDAYCTGNRSGCRPARSVCKKYKDRRISEFYRKYVGYADSGIYLVTAERTGNFARKWCCSNNDCFRQDVKRDCKGLWHDTH